MINRLLFLIVFLLSTAICTYAQEEIPPSRSTDGLRDKGRVVVVASGMSGPAHYRTVAKEIAQLGYDVVLYDGNTMKGSQGRALEDDIAQAQQMPHALPGKVALVGFSLGGGMSLFYGTPWSDKVAGVVVWYPATSFIKNISGFVDRLSVPVLMFAGEDDTYRNCCLVDKAHQLADAAKSAGKPFDLVTYPGAQHDFVKGGSHYNASAYSDAFARTASKLKEYLQ